MAPQKRSSCQCGYGRNVNEMKNLKRHLGTCSIFRKNFVEQSSEIVCLKKRVEELENQSILKQNEINELKDKLIKALEEGKNTRPNVVNNVENMTINVSYAFGEEPMLTARNVSFLMNSFLKLEEVVPQYLKQKHFAQSETSNIRLDFTSDNIETVRKDEKTGQLKWQRERRNVRKFCQDLAMNTVEELNDVYNVPLKSEINFENDKTEEMLGVQVKNMILDHS